MGKETKYIAGIPISFERHGDADRDALFLVHCGGGHSGWWSEIVPTLMQTHYVVTLDLSGHGDSGRRPEYHPTHWANELCTLVREFAPNRQILLVGHSLGGLVGIYAAAMAPDLVKKLILVDPPVLDVKLRDTTLLTKTYERPEDALSKFRLRPPNTNASINRLHEVAMQGLKQVTDGWTWKYDPMASQRFTVPDVASEIALVQCPTCCIYGEFSPYVDRETVSYISKLTGQHVEAVMIPNAYHHVPLDAPAELAEAIYATSLIHA